MKKNVKETLRNVNMDAFPNSCIVCKHFYVGFWPQEIVCCADVGIVVEYYNENCLCQVCDHFEREGG